MRFDRNGFAYTADRRTGEMLNANPFVFVNWAKGINLATGAPEENPEKRTSEGEIVTDICPAAPGGKDQQPAAFSPRTNFFYVPTNNLCMDYEALKALYFPGRSVCRRQLTMKAGPGGHRGELMAWDAVAGRKVWGIKEFFPVYSGVLATAGDLVFYGTLDRNLKAVDARTGAVVFQTRLESGIVGHPMTFIGPDGKQRVAIYSGPGGAIGGLVPGNLSLDDPYRGPGHRQRDERPAAVHARRWRGARVQDSLRAAVMIRPFMCVVLVLLSGMPDPSSGVVAAGPRELRVCGDPDNLPFSNRRQQGFENKIAQLIAKELHATVRYTWMPQRRGFIRRTLTAGTCDVVMGVPGNYDMVLATRPYYRSSYVFVYPKSRHLQLRSFDDPVLRELRIGLHEVGEDGANQPPAHALARRGIVRNIVGYTMWDVDSVANPPGKVIDAVAEGEVDAAIVWGPFGGTSRSGRKSRSRSCRLKRTPARPRSRSSTTSRWG